MDSTQLQAAVMPNVEKTSQSWGELFMGAVETGLQGVIKKEFSEQDPPAPANETVVDTGRGELIANMQERMTPQNLAIVGTLAAIGIIGLLIVLRNK